MEEVNQTFDSEFFLLGFSEKPEQEMPLFGLFLGIYMITLVGNLLIMLTIIFDSHLHTPMYFFLSNLSFVDLCLASTTVPKMLKNVLIHSTAIPYADCLVQMCFFLVFTCMDNLLLTLMSYDRFVAICQPLHYVAIMNPQLCVLLVLFSWIVSFLIPLIHTVMAVQLSFCKDHDIPHFFCDLSQVLKLSCSDTSINNILVYFAASLLGVVPMAGIFFSYIKICASILRIPSRGGKYKVFSTCGSHLCVVSLFYGTLLSVYLSSSTTYSPWKNSIISAINNVFTPMLNPFIYSLRNKDIKDSLRRLINRLTSYH
ncbi:olfactory receptor 7C1-like [Macrotis lagotis]|uniref:olfactory receptor 7C1-like n=1 Tax=Macrotis lagotis TaxID=92651 RepID=UPI003D684DC3